MKPVDFRNETFASLQARLAGQRQHVLLCWRAHGPGTTEEVAARAGMSILSFRPRTTELYQLGFIACMEEQSGVQRSAFSVEHSAARGARYRARTTAEHLDWIKHQRALADRPPVQPELAL